MITLTGFGKDYGDFTAVESIDLQIEAGETVRLHRSQRRRQKHDDSVSGDAAESQSRTRRRLQRLQRHGRSRWRSSKRRLHAR